MLVDGYGSQMLLDSQYTMSALPKTWFIFFGQKTKKHLVVFLRLNIVEDLMAGLFCSLTVMTMKTLMHSQLIFRRLLQ